MSRLRAPILARPCRELSSSEMVRIFAALGQESLYAQVFFLFCILGGYSAASVKALQWRDVESGEEPGEAEQTTETGTLSTIDHRVMTMNHLPPILLRRLYQLPRRDPAVFHPHREEGCFWSPQNARLYWGRVCRRAQLPGLKLNDVRCTWARWMTRQDGQCRQLEAALDRATVRMYQAAQPPVPMKTVRVVPMVRKKAVKPIVKRYVQLITTKAEWPGWRELGSDCRER